VWNARLLLLIAAVALFAGCSKAERRRVNNALHEINDFHVAVAKAAISTGVAASSFAATTHVDEPECRTYVINAETKRAVEDKDRIVYFIRGYYANDANRLIFPFDVTVRDFQIAEFDDITLRWWVATTSTDAEVVFTGMAAEKDRIRNALTKCGYEYSKGITMIVDIQCGDGLLRQSSYKIRW
jgi:hypothetical protein